MDYPTKSDLRFFTSLIKSDKYAISKYLPAISEDWYSSVSDCVLYVKSTSKYYEEDILYGAARLLYKVVKKHELTDSNKRTGVIVTNMFLLLNNYGVSDPRVLKNAAKRIAKTKGRKNEELMIKRIMNYLNDQTFKL